MAFETCQKIKIQFTNCFGSTTVPIRPICEKGNREAKICAEGETEKEAGKALENLLKGECDTRPQLDLRSSYQVNGCQTLGIREASVKKLDWLQRLGIKMSDLWNRVF